MFGASLIELKIVAKAEKLIREWLFFFLKILVETLKRKPMNLAIDLNAFKWQRDCGCCSLNSMKSFPIGLSCNSDRRRNSQTNRTFFKSWWISVLSASFRSDASLNLLKKSFLRLFIFLFVFYRFSFWLIIFLFYNFGSFLIKNFNKNIKSFSPRETSLQMICNRFSFFPFSFPVSFSTQSEFQYAQTFFSFPCSIGKNFFILFFKFHFFYKSWTQKTNKSNPKNDHICQWLPKGGTN